MPPPACEPLCCFDDRLYFTTFPHPAPDPQLLNNQTLQRPKVRGRNHHGARQVPPDDGSPYYYFTVDDQLVYLSFFQDWGPLNLAMVYKACILFHELLQDEDLAGHRLVLYSSDDPRRKANAALLMSLYVLIVQRRPPWEAFHPIAEVEFMPFRDAGRGPSDFNLSIQDCLWGMWKASQNGLCDMNEFSVEEYEYYEKVENGDWNWITPGFIAFASPLDPTWLKSEKERKAREAEAGGTSMAGPSNAGPESPVRAPKRSSITPATVTALQRKLPQPFLNCLDYFEKRSVRMVVRLNTELYDRKVFLEHGIDHVEMYFDDGTNPTDEITRKFIDLSDEIISNGGAVAVHCKAGLGRTGTLIGAYLIWKYGFTANEAIAFMRIVRPGSVVGPQQHYMYLKQLEWTKWSASDEIRRQQSRAASAAVTVAVAPIVTPATPPAEADMAEPAPSATPEMVPEEDEEAQEVETAVAAEATVTVVLAPSTPPAGALPPVTPNRHVAAAQARARAITPPMQPRKTPMAQRVAMDPDEDDVLGRAGPPSLEGDADEESDMLPALPVAPSAKPIRGKPRGSGGRTRGVTASERTTRITRSSVTGSGIRKLPPPSSPSKPVAAATKVPRLVGPPSGPAAGAVTRAAAAKAAAGSSMPGPSSRRVPPTPSRLPTLVSKRGHQATASMSTGAAAASRALADAAKSIGRPGAGNADTWMKHGKDAVVVTASKKDARPGLRPIRRRRSSFSAADVVA